MMTDILIFIISGIIFVALLSLGIKIIKLKNIKIEQLGRMLVGFAILIFLIPWVGIIYSICVNIKEIRIIPKVFLSYIREPLVIILILTSSIILILGMGIRRRRRWSLILTIILMITIILICLTIFLSSLQYALFVSGDMDVMAAGIIALLTGTLGLNIIILPSLLFLFCLTRPDVRGQFK